MSETVDFLAIGGWVHGRRQERGMTLEELEDLSGCSLRTVRRIEAGRGGCSIANVVAVVEALGGEIRVEVREDDYAA